MLQLRGKAEVAGETYLELHGRLMKTDEDEGDRAPGDRMEPPLTTGATEGERNEGPDSREV